MRLLLVTPPMTQLNTPYPATAYLTGFLRQHEARLGLEVGQADAALELFLRVFSRAGLARVRDALSAPAADDAPPSVAGFLAHGERYVATVEPCVRFLQGRDPAFALRVIGRELLPEGPRFAAIDEGPGADDDDALGWAFGGLGVADRAKYHASLYIDDIADAIRDGIQPDFELSRYGERLAASAASFDPLRDALEGEPALIDEMLDELAVELCARHRPDVVGLTAPFPGNLYGALRIARAIRAAAPRTRIVLGGGYVNTELRELSEPRLFDYVDYVTLDDGEAPMLALLEQLRDPRASGTSLHRTFVREAGAVRFVTDPARKDVALRDAGTPSYAGLALDRYVSLFEMLNPMHRLWSDGRWNKLTVAHGCYWKQCTFCDVTLDYIARYDRAPADLLVDRIEALIAETGQTGFHFVDEAAPPAALRALAERLLARNVTITWWGNVRFERAFTPELVELLARSGLVAVSGGLEVASDRLLALMKKGVTVEQVARVTRAFVDAGVMVHAYLMYGFPTQTAQDTIDALECVRQLFAEGCLQSAFWHRFTATVHSPVGRAPELFGIRLRPAPGPTFARNDVAFDDPTGCDHDLLGAGLRKAVYNFMHGVGLDADPRSWFERPARRARSSAQPGIPRATVAPDLIRRALTELDLVASRDPE
ncbi:MAG TPA: B12-binding domain-containing radical SAM protein [Kofleriaceae bacterium]|nr:B12-binding domain-containing radical SAM protein [Kofleriaceae bacterium]